MKRVKQLENLITEYMSLRSLEAEAKSSKDAIGGLIKQVMDELEIDEYHASCATARYKSQIQNTIDSKMLRAELPEIASRYLTSKEIKVLRIA